MKKTKIDNSGAERAAKAQAEAAAAAQNLSKNFAADLTTENVANVTPGGTAALADTMDVETQRKRRQGQGLSSQLGINV